MSDRLKAWLTQREEVAAVDPYRVPVEALRALRAVVELHQGASTTGFEHTEEADVCAECGAPWPCPTIRAIGKVVFREGEEDRPWVFWGF